ncbi:MAG: response regulator [Sutterellaceae bacterium]|nr:response regulator [Sutterellaceae bacterium]
MTAKPLITQPLIRVVDDDIDQLTALEMLLLGQGWDVAVYSSAGDFLRGDTPSRPGCLILDVRMPGMSGLELQAEMARREYPLPIVFLTGHGDVEMAVETLKSGAKDFLLKPVQPEKLLKTVAKVVQDDCDQRAMPIDETTWKKNFASLTDRERDIIRMVAAGKLNRQIALKLQISERTVQVHRLGAYKKLDVHSVADLAPLIVLLERGIL